MRTVEIMKLDRVLAGRATRSHGDYIYLTPARALVSSHDTALAMPQENAHLCYAYVQILVVAIPGCLQNV